MKVMYVSQKFLCKLMKVIEPEYKFYGLDGVYVPNVKTIYIDKEMDEWNKFITLIHEVVHWIMHYIPTDYIDDLWDKLWRCY